MGFLYFVIKDQTLDRYDITNAISKLMLVHVNAKISSSRVFVLVLYSSRNLKFNFNVRKNASPKRWLRLQIASMSLILHSELITHASVVILDNLELFHLKFSWKNFDISGVKKNLLETKWGKENETTNDV